MKRVLLILPLVLSCAVKRKESMADAPAPIKGATAIPKVDGATLTLKQFEAKPALVGKAYALNLILVPENRGTFAEYAICANAKCKPTTAAPGIIITGTRQVKDLPGTTLTIHAHACVAEKSAVDPGHHCGPWQKSKPVTLPVSNPKAQLALAQEGALEDSIRAKGYSLAASLKGENLSLASSTGEPLTQEQIYLFGDSMLTKAFENFSENISNDPNIQSRFLEIQALRSQLRALKDVGRLRSTSPHQ